MYFIEETFISTSCLLCKTCVYDFLTFSINKGSDKSIIFREGRKCMFYASKRA